LREGDYNQYKANVLAGPSEGDVFDNFDIVRDHIAASGGDTLLSLAVATFYFDLLKGHTSNDELRWACYAWTSHSYKHLEALARKDFIQLYNTLRTAMPSPPIREEFTLYPESGGPIVMTFDEGRLINSPAARTARGIYPAAGAQILRIRAPGGGALEEQIPGLVSAAVASTGPASAAVASIGPESVIEVESSESEMGDDESLESDSEESTEETIEKKEAKLAKLKTSVNKHRGRLKASLAERAVLVTKEIKKENEDEQERRRNEKKKPPAPDEDEPMTAAATAEYWGAGCVIMQLGTQFP
jgi:hypothetical protein